MALPDVNKDDVGRYYDENRRQQQQVKPQVPDQQPQVPDDQQPAQPTQPSPTGFPTAPRDYGKPRPNFPTTTLRPGDRPSYDKRDRLIEWERQKREIKDPRTGDRYEEILETERREHKPLIRRIFG